MFLYKFPKTGQVSMLNVAKTYVHQKMFGQKLIKVPSG